MVVCAHLGRPKGAPDERYTLRPVAERLGELLGAEVAFAADTAGDGAKAAVEGLADGGVALLENVRFEPGETSKDDAERGAFADRLAALRRRATWTTRSARCTASTPASTTWPRGCRAHAGDLLLQRAGGAVPAGRPRRRHADRPYVVVLGGSKVSDKLGVISALLPKVDRLLVGGGMCFTFLKARGFEVGDSLLEADQVETCRRLLERDGDRIGLPVDVVVATEVSEDAETRVVDVGRDPGRQQGPGRRADHRGRLRRRGGRRRHGVLERADGRLRGGPVRGRHHGAWPRRSRPAAAFTVVGGGDSAAAVRQLGRRRGRLRPHLHRRRRVAGIPGGPHPAGLASSRAGGLRWPSASRGRRPLVAGNWKMNLTHLEAIALVQKIAFSLSEPELEAVEVVVLPPFTAIRSVQTLVDGDKLLLGYGAQDLSPHASGAYTGDVSGPMLAKLGCSYVVVGHSERRQYHDEDDAVVAAKVQRGVRATS